MKTSSRLTLATIFFILSRTIFAQTGYPGEWAPGMEGWGLAEPCIPTAAPWHLGGDYIYTNPLNPPGDDGVSNVNYVHDIGTCNNFPFILKANNFQSVFIRQNGLIGINNAGPGAALDVNNPNANDRVSFRIFGNGRGELESAGKVNFNFGSGESFNINEGSVSGGYTNYFNIQSGGNVGIGTSGPSVKLSVQANENQTVLGDNVGAAIRISNQWANTFGTRSELQFALGQNANERIAVIAAEYSDYNNGVGGDIVFGTAKGAVVSEKMRINYEGQVWVGKRPTQGVHANTFNFAAEKIVAKEIYVTLQGNWADYVFDKDYKLPSLSEIESYYKKHHHLAEIPSASEVSQNGVNVAEMNALLLKKVEELTLHMVELNKKIEKLEKSRK